MPTNLAIQGRFLRHVNDGTIYGYTESLSKNPLVEEVTEEQAFPERFIPKKQKKRKPKLDLATDEKVVAETKTPKAGKAALNEEASRGV